MAKRPQHRITIRGNTSDQIKGDAIRLRASPDANVDADISDNQGTDIGGHAVNVDLNAHNELLALTFQIQDMVFKGGNDAYRQALGPKVDSLIMAGEDKGMVVRALKALRDGAIDVGAKVIAEMTTAYLRSHGLS